MTTPAGRIIPRDVRFDIAGAARRDWFGGDKVKTALMDCFSIALPSGERFFIRSLKHYLPHIADERLRADVQDLCLQEAYHTREHENYNAAMAALGYPVAEMERRPKAPLDAIGKPVARLAATCAIEHITATFSALVLKHPAILDGAPEAYRRLWTWHALEELEHKAVALDVFNAVTGKMSRWQRYALRVGTMNIVLVLFTLSVTRNMMTYVRTDGDRAGLSFWARYLKLLFVNPGFYRRSARYFLAYYRPRFDPARQDDSELLVQGRRGLEGAAMAASGCTGPGPAQRATGP
jgi:predicted metal-dependent hydrolase